MRLSCIILFLLLLANNVLADNSRKLALIIGNSSYETPLKNPVNDAKDVSKKLKSLGFDVETLINASKKQMRKAVNNLVDRASDYDAVLFYYSGHGLQVKGENYLVPVDAVMGYESDAEFECENLNHILANLSESDCRMKIVVLDACRNNPFERRWYKSVESKGLTKVNDYQGTLIHYATAPGRVASDGSGRNSPYTSAFLEVLDKPNIPLFEFFNEVANTVLDKTGGNQEPTLSAGAFRGRFYFNRQEQHETAVSVPVHKNEKKVEPVREQSLNSDPVKGRQVKGKTVKVKAPQQGMPDGYKTKGYLGMVSGFLGTDNGVSIINGYRFSPHFSMGLETGFAANVANGLGLPLNLHIISEFGKKRIAMFADLNTGMFAAIDYGAVPQMALTLGCRVRMRNNPRYAMWYGLNAGLTGVYDSDYYLEPFPVIQLKVSFSF